MCVVIIVILSWVIDIFLLKAIVSVRAFTTSQSAEAHFILFRRIFEIATHDTGIPVRFQHIHGEGFRVWIADAHKGQALGNYVVLFFTSWLMSNES